MSDFFIAMKTINRKLYIDIAKVIAIFAVILVHLQINGKTLSAKDIAVGFPVIDKIWYWFRYIVTNCSNTMFMLITGAVRLRKRDDGGFVDYKKNFNEIFKIIVMFLLFQIPFYLFYHFKYGNEISIANFLLTNYSRYVVAIYWYIPWFVIPFMLIYPLLKKFSYVANKRDCEYIIIVFLICEFIINIIKSKFNVGSNISFDFFKDIYVYPIMGDLICNKYSDEEIDIKKLIVIFVFAILHWIINDKYYIMNVYVSAIVLYLLRYISIKNNDFEKIRNKHIGDMIVFASSNALLFYLLHPYSLKLLFRVGDKFYNSSKGVIDIIGILVFWLLNFVLCYVVIFVYKKIKNGIIALVNK